MSMDTYRSNRLPTTGSNSYFFPGPFFSHDFDKNPIQSGSRVPVKDKITLDIRRIAAKTNRELDIISSSLMDVDDIEECVETATAIPKSHNQSMTELTAMEVHQSSGQLVLVAGHEIKIPKISKRKETTLSRKI